MNSYYRTFMLVALLAAGCSKERGEGDTAGGNVDQRLTEQQRQLAAIRTGRLEYRVVSHVVACTGEIEVPPVGMASVTAPLGGYIVDMNIVPGKYVRKGTVLATLNNPEYITLQQSYLETSGQLRFAAQDYDRQRSLAEQNAAAQKKFQESESQYAVLKARLTGLRKQLELIGVDVRALESGSIQPEIALRAPIAGYVTKVNHHKGQFVEPREVSFHIVDLSDLHLHLNVFEKDVARIRQDQLIRFRLAGNEEQIFWGKVSLVSPELNDDTRTFDVHGHIEVDSDLLKPGMYLDAEILLSRDSVYALPQQAIVTREGRTYAMVEDAGEYRAVRLETGAVMDGWVEVKNVDALRDKPVVMEGGSRIFSSGSELTGD